MSLQKLKIKRSKHSETYSKNPILNSLIKQKLSGQMSLIKQSTNKIIQRQDEPPLTAQRQKSSLQLQSKRMTSLSSWSMQKIHDSLRFDPVPNLKLSSSYPNIQVLSFVESRLRETSIIEPAKLKSVIEAREKPNDLVIKMSAKDRFSYQKINNRQRIETIEKEVADSVRAISNDLWIPEQPEVKQMFIDDSVQEQFMRKIQMELKIMKQRNEVQQGLILSSDIHQSENSENQRKSPVLSSSEIQKERTRQLSILGFPDRTPFVNYNAKRYHKDDYINLEQFLRQSLNWLILQNIRPVEHLSKAYAVYLSTWKELIRLTYIQCWQKGLLFQKLLWSFLRLIYKVIQCQHFTNYTQFKQQSSLLSQTRNQYQERILKLQNALSETQSQLTSAKNSQSRLILSALSFQKVNQYLSQDLDRITSQSQQSRQQLSYLKNKYHSLLNQLVQNQMIQNDQKRLYMINKYHQPEMLMSLVEEGGSKLAGDMIYQESKQDKKTTKPKFKDLPQSVKLKMPSFNRATAQQQYEFTRYGKKVKKLQNQLNNYWQRKEDDLQIRAALQRITDIRIKDAAVQTNHRQKVFVDTSMQVGQDDQEQQKFDFQEFIKQKIQQQRTYWKNKENQSQNLYISLQQLYDDSYRRIQLLTRANSELKQQVQILKHNNSSLNQKLSNQIASKYIMEENLKLTKIQHQKQVIDLEKRISILQQQIVRVSEAEKGLQKRLKAAKENNDILVRRNVDGETKLRIVQKERDSIISKVKNVAPWLQKFMENTEQMEESSFLTSFIEISKKIEEYLGEYVQKDAALFSLTK